MGKAYIIGTGPGDEELLTIKAVKVLEKCTAVLYDRLVSNNILNYLKEDCEIYYCGKEPGCHYKTQEEINEMIVKLVKDGHIVGRIKGGDPYVFGRGGEEGELLKAEGIEFEVVPGVTSAIGGLCYAGIPITHRDHASSFHVITGHLRKDGKENPEINWNALANMKGTLVFLMGVSNLKNISENLIKEGMSKDTPVAFVSWATRYNQRVVTATLEDAYEVAIREEVKPPTLIVVGTVVNLRDTLNFFEKKPLFGKSIMVTRSRSQNSKLVERIMDLGGNPIEIPTIKIEKVQDNKELENEIKNLKDYTYLVLTSKNGVDIFFDKLDEMGLDCRALANIKVCSIGAATSKAIIRRGIKPDIQPEKAVGESLYDELKDIVSKEDKILIPRAKNAREFLVKKLNEISNVTEVVTYESVMDDSKKEEAISALEEGNLDYITFASSSTVTNFINLIGEENKDKLSNTKIISIGKITTKTILDNGLEVYKESEKASIESMIEAMSE